MDKNYVKYKDHYKVKDPHRGAHLDKWKWKKGETGNPLLPDDHPKKRPLNKGMKPPWKPGESGNPKGRPVGSISLVERLKAYLRRHPDELERIVVALVAEGKLGNIVATKEMLDRLDGKVAERHRIEGELPIRLIFVPAQELLNAPETQQDANLGVLEGESIPTMLTEGQEE